MYIYQVERDLLQRAIKAQAQALQGKLLDVGSGMHARYRDHFLHVREYLTLDIEASAQPDILGSADAIPVADQTFQSILCNQVIGDLVHPIRVIQEFYRVLSPGGVVLLTEGFMNELHGEPRDYWRFTPHGMRALFEESGFKVETCYLLGGFATVMVQTRTRFLINVLALHRRHPLFGRCFSVFFKVSGMLAMKIDQWLLRHHLAQTFGLIVLVVARKPV